MQLLFTVFSALVSVAAAASVVTRATCGDPSEGVLLFRALEKKRHLYTVASSQLDSKNVTLAAPIGLVFPTQVPGSIPWYRLSNGARFYTTSEVERNALLVIPDYKLKDEGVLAYVYPNASCGGVHLFGLYNWATGDQVYTEDTDVKWAVEKKKGYRYNPNATVYVLDKDTTVAESSQMATASGSSSNTPSPSSTAESNVIPTSGAMKGAVFNGGAIAVGLFWVLVL